MGTIPVACTNLANLWITIIFPRFISPAVIFVVTHYVKEKVFYSSC